MIPKGYIEWGGPEDQEDISRFPKSDAWLQFVEKLMASGIKVYFAPRTLPYSEWRFYMKFPDGRIVEMPFTVPDQVRQKYGKNEF